MKADESPGAEAMELALEEMLDIPLQPLGLLAISYCIDVIEVSLVSSHAEEPSTNSLTSSTSILLHGSQRLPAFQRVSTAVDDD